MPHARPHPLAGTRLTARQVEILGMAAEDMTNCGIARRLGLTEHTVKQHFLVIYAKLGVHGRAGAVCVAFRRGYLR